MSDSARAQLAGGSSRPLRSHRTQILRAVSRATVYASWGYLLAVSCAWLLIYSGGDRWWPATVLLFGPRWLLGVPSAVLAPLAATTHRRSLWPLAVALAVVVFAIEGFRVPWTWARAPSGPRLRILTYNVEDGAVAGDDLVTLIREVQPDIVALQECPADRYSAAFDGWVTVQQGELLLASRFPICGSEVLTEVDPGNSWPQPILLRCTIAAPFGQIEACIVHLPSPRQGLQEVLDRHTIVAPSRSDTLIQQTASRSKQSMLAAKAVAKTGPEVLVAGDFNMPVDSTVYRRDWSGLANAFSVRGWGLGHTRLVSWGIWRYGARIDHVLTGTAWIAVRCWVGPDLGSDHLPLIAELHYVSTSASADSG